MSIFLSAEKNVTFWLEYCIIKSWFFLLLINFHSIERWYWLYESTCIGRASFETYTLCHRYRVHQGPSGKTYVRKKRAKHRYVKKMWKTYVRKKRCKIQLWFSVKKKLQKWWWSYFTLSPTGSQVAILVEVIQTPTLTNFQISKYFFKYIYGILLIIMIWVKSQECQGNITNLEAEPKGVFGK